MKIDRINASLVLTVINELLQTLVVMVFYAQLAQRSTSKILWSLIPSAGLENVKRLIPFPTCSLDLDRACACACK